MTLDRLPNTGQAVIIDIGEGRDIHPKNKVDVGRRLARLALANDYGIDIASQSPRYQSMEKNGGSIVLTFDHLTKAGDPLMFSIRLALRSPGRTKIRLGRCQNTVRQPN